MSWPAALLTPRRRRLALFALLELTLAMAVPFLAIAGYHALLDSRAGRFVEEPSEGDPGWRAIVEPSPLAAVVESDQGRLTGITLLAGHAEGGSGGTAVLVPGTLQVDGVSLDSLEPAAAVQALGGALRLRITSVEVMTEARWEQFFQGRSYSLANPDPVVDGDGEPLLAVGQVELDGDNTAVFLGRPAPGTDPLTVLYRRDLFWSAVLADPPPVGSANAQVPLAVSLGRVVGPSARVVELPLEATNSGAVVDVERAEALIRDVVPVPAGAAPGDRLQVRVIDRTGGADLPAIAAEVAATGLEVIEIGNATEFDQGGTHLVVPAGVEDPGLYELAQRTGATTVLDDEADADPVVTLLIGADFVANT